MKEIKVMVYGRWTSYTYMKQNLYEAEKKRNFLQLL
jgi:hypothetical protein